MKETTITSRVYNRERQAEVEHPMTAYADDRFPLSAATGRDSSHVRGRTPTPTRGAHAGCT